MSLGVIALNHSSAVTDLRPVGLKHDLIIRIVMNYTVCLQTELERIQIV